jgi:hypothetical protein
LAGLEENYYQLFKGSYTASNNLDSVLENLTEDERWIAETWLKELVAAFEDDPQGVAESVAATAIGYGAEAWGRILQAADSFVVASLLGGGSGDRLGLSGSQIENF